MTTRTLTVSRLCPTSLYIPEFSCMPSTRYYPPVPFLRLSGKWLEAAGFEIGSKVRVQVEGDRLVVERADGL